MKRRQNDKEPDNSVEENQSAKKRRQSTRPPLSRSLANVIILYLSEKKDYRKIDRSPWPHWAEVLQDTELPKYTKGTSCRRKFLAWAQCLDVQEIDGVNQLVLKEGRKIVPCLEDFSKIIREAHRGMGTFAENNDLPTAFEGENKLRPIHNPVEKCLKLIQEKFAFGLRQFGMQRSHVYKEVRCCPECSVQRFKVPPSEMINEAQMIDPDFGNEMNFVAYKHAPSSMVIKGPSKDSIWHDQDALAREDNLYNKLLGVIQEIYLELGQCVQDDANSTERLVTKICCAEKLVKQLKKDLKSVFTEKMTSPEFMQNYSDLQSHYTANCQLEVFLHDLCLLTNIYRMYRNQEFVDKINQGLEHYTHGTDNVMKVVWYGTGLALEGRKRKAVDDNRDGKNKKEMLM